MQCEDFIINATDVREVNEDGKRQVKFRLQVPGRVTSGQETAYDAGELTKLLATWEATPPNLAKVIRVGQFLGQVLFPPGLIRDAFLASLGAHKNSTTSRLRIILNLEGILNNVPWEFLLFHSEQGEATQNAILGLMSQVSIVRQVDRTVPDLKGIKAATVPAQMVVALANPNDTTPLALEEECHVIAQSLGQSPCIKVTYVEHATPDNLLGGLEHVHLFHFAGHGEFSEHPTAGAAFGVGTVLLEDGQGHRHTLKAPLLAQRLRKAGVRVVVLGACLTAKRDDVNMWSSTAANLLNGGIGAVVAMQYALRDSSAIVFARAFYEALAQGFPVDQAVAKGRIAIFEKEDFRGFGTPVLYMGNSDGVVFPEYTGDPALKEEREKIHIVVNLRADMVEGKVIGIQVDKMKGGEAKATVTTVAVEEGAEVIGFAAGSLTSGNVDVDVTTQRVGKGATLIGTYVGSTPPGSIHRPGSSRPARWERK